MLVECSNSSKPVVQAKYPGKFIKIIYWLARLCETMAGKEGRLSTGQTVQCKSVPVICEGGESKTARCVKTSGSLRFHHLNISQYCREEPNLQLVQFNYLSSYLVLFIWLMTTFLAVRW